jgi:S1-C subfamily serine protease
MANPKWRFLEKKADYELVVHAYGQGTWRGRFFGIEASEGMGLASVGIASKFVLALADARGAQLYLRGRRLTGLSLTGSRAAFESVVDCHRERKQPAERSASRERKRETNQSGTGIIISNQSHILTNHHVVSGCRDILISRVGEASTIARVVAADARNDLALLNADLTNIKAPPLRRDVRLGENVYVFGFPLAGLLSKSGNFTTGTITALSGVDDDTRMFQISAPVQPGNSGGPLIDRFGNVVGVVVSKLNASAVAQATGDLPQNVNFAIKLGTALTFLEANSLVPPTTPDTKVLEVSDIAELAKRFTVYIECKAGSR